MDVVSNAALFFYPGEEIRVGDMVRTPHAVATIEALVAPGDEWAGEAWPEGLIGIEEVWGEAMSMICFDPYSAGWEDLQFVKRSGTT